MYSNNVLITNVGRRGYLTRYIKAIKDFNGKVFVSDCDDTASGLYGDVDGYFILPRPVDNPELYVQELLSLCKENRVDVVIPVIDPEIDILSRYREMFSEEGIFVAVSSEEVLKICYDKSVMNSFLTENGFEIPLTYYSIEDFRCDYDNHRVDFPVIIKPIFGSGSVSTYKVSAFNELESLFEKGMMIQDFVPGVEYGIDTFNDMSGTPLRCVVKRKIAMRSGETDKSVIVKNKLIQSQVLKMAQKLGHLCNLDCDVLLHDDKVYFIDLNPRFGGGYPATHASGENYLELVLKLCKGEAIESDFESYKSDILVMKEINVVIRRL